MTPVKTRRLIPQIGDVIQNKHRAGDAGLVLDVYIPDHNHKQEQFAAVYWFEHRCIFYCALANIRDPGIEGCGYQIIATLDGE